MGGETAETLAATKGETCLQEKDIQIANDLAGEIHLAEQTHLAR